MRSFALAHSPKIAQVLDTALRRGVYAVRARSHREAMGRKDKAKEQQLREIRRQIIRAERDTPTYPERRKRAPKR